MATNPLGRGKALISASVPTHVAEEIARRAEALGISKSGYASLILTHWYETGALPVNAPDHALKIVGAQNAKKFA